MAGAWRDLLAECGASQLEFLDTLLVRMREITGVEIAKLRARHPAPGQ